MPDFSVRAYRTASLIARVAPLPVAKGLGRVASLALARFSTDQRTQVERHLERVHGRSLSPLRMRREVQRTFDSYARYFVDSFRLPFLTRKEIDDGFSFSGLEHVYQALADGHGPIVAMPHVGGWEWAAAWLTRVGGFQVTAVVEPLEPPELFEWFLDFCEKLGLNILPLGPNVVAELTAAIGRGDIVTLLCDRDIGGGGVEVSFFGERTTLPAGPALLALRTGAPLLPSVVYFRGSRSHGEVHPPMQVERRGRLRDDVARITQELAYELESLILAAPDQWHLMQPNWPSDYELAGDVGAASA